MHLQEECRSWDVNEVVFSPALWPTYHHLMRSDFQLFDEYVYEHEGAWVHGDVDSVSGFWLAVHSGCW